MEKKTEKREVEVATGKKLVGARGKVAVRGRKFEGYVIRKFDKRVTIRFERVNFIRKYERYSKSQTKIHAYLPEEFKDDIQIGDYIQVQECRPLSKIVHHVVVRKIRSGEEKSI